MEQNKVKILFYGDIVGKSGRFAIKYHLAQNNNYDFVIANVENASHGFGLTQKNYDDLISYGIDCMTSGNHIWDKRDIFEYINEADKLIRPINYKTHGVGSRIFEIGDTKIAVMNILGKIFINITEFSWEEITNEIKRLKEITPIVIIDFHGEATAEKICFAKYCSQFNVSAVFGTHTHVQTADEQIIQNTAYITDAGFCGSFDSVIGMDYNSSLSRFLTCIPERYEVAEGNQIQINAVEVEIDKNTGSATNINRINTRFNKEEINEK